MAHPLDGMTRARWDALTHEERERIRDNGGLSPQLTGLEGWRVEVVTTYGETRRFIVGKSTGWRPCHLEVSKRSALWRRRGRAGVRQRAPTVQGALRRVKGDSMHATGLYTKSMVKRERWIDRMNTADRMQLCDEAARGICVY